jgi:uncharacterized protein (TIGR02588 family)
MSHSGPQRTTAERITLAISTLILVSILGLAGWASIRSGDDLPTIDVDVHLAEVRQTGPDYYIPISITNAGGLTAQDVVVTGELHSGADTPEVAEIIITFLAGGETENAEFIFSTDPREGNLIVRPTSFMHP